MDMKNLEKATDIYAILVTEGELTKKGPTGDLYDEYYGNAEVYDILNTMLKKLNLNIYEYGEGLYLSAGEGNRVFGYTNEELKRRIGLKYNKELYLVYFIIYQVLLTFYSDSSTYQFKEYVRIENTIEDVTKSLSVFTKDIAVYDKELEEKESFVAVALAWDELPAKGADDAGDIRAAKGSKAGIVKLTYNFLTEEKLFVEVSGRYYPTDRLKAIAEHYFEDYRGNIYAALSGDKDA